MEYIDFFKQLFTIAFGGFIALVLAFYMLWPKVETLFLKLNNVNQSRSMHRESMQLKFAAYERLILLASRISPQQTMLRHYGSTTSLDQFKQSIVADIESEFQHNYTQQLYVSDAAWTIVKDLKQSTVGLIQNARKGLGPQATIDDFASVLLKHVSELDVNPYDAAQIILKKELSA